MIDQTSMSAMSDEFTKLAFKLRVGDVEDQVGDYMTDKQEERIRELFRDAKSKSFSLRHPWLTGIPTLGIAPAVAHGNAVQKVIKRMARTDPKFRATLTNNRRRNEDMEHERYKSDAPTRAAGAIAGGGVAVAKLLSAARERREHEGNQ